MDEEVKLIYLQKDKLLYDAIRPTTKGYMLAAKCVVEVLVKGTRQRFCANLYELYSPELFSLHPTDFYEKWGGLVPEVPHFEIEVTEPTQSTITATGIILHTHRSCRHADERMFVCYPKRIPTAWDAFENFCIWSVGSAITLTGGPDLNTLFSEAGGNKDVFFAIAMKKFNTRLVFKSIDH